MLARWRFQRRTIGGLLREESGLALVEFALSLPIVLTLGLVGLEIANFAIAHLRVSNIAVTTADNAARVRDAIDEADVNELFIGATLAGESIDFIDRGRIMLSDLEPSMDGETQWIRWQRCKGLKDVDPTYRPLTDAGVQITNGTEIFRTDRKTVSLAPSRETASTLTGVGRAGNQIAAQGGTAVMVAEAYYDYEPLLPNPITSGAIIHYASAFNVRQRNDHTLRNNGRITPLSCGA